MSNELSARKQNKLTVEEQLAYVLEHVPGAVEWKILEGEQSQYNWVVRLGNNYNKSGLYSLTTGKYFCVYSYPRFSTALARFARVAEYACEEEDAKAAEETQRLELAKQVRKLLGSHAKIQHDQATPWGLPVTKGKYTKVVVSITALGASLKLSTKNWQPHYHNAHSLEELQELLDFDVKDGAELKRLSDKLEELHAKHHKGVIKGVWSSGETQYVYL